MVLCPPASSTFWAFYVSTRADPQWQQEIWHGTWPPEDPVEAQRKHRALVDRRGYGLWAVGLRQQSPPLSPIRDPPSAGVADGAEMKWVGWIGYRNLDDVAAPLPRKWAPPPGTLEVYVGLAREYQGKGYGTEALRALVRDAFEFRGLNRLTACVLEENVASMKCFERVGFVRTEDDLGYEDEGVYLVMSKT